MWKAVRTQPRRKHEPSGVIIAWLGNDDKVHTQSIPRNPWRSMMSAKGYAEAEFMCHQLDYMGGDTKSMPIITAGLTRIEARQALHLELTAKSEVKKLQ